MEPRNQTQLRIPILTRSTNFAITWGADNKLKTPYAEALDFSIQRELKGGVTLEVAYVGRLGRHLLQALDLAEPANFTDPQGGGDYFTNAAKLSALVDANGGNPQASVPAIPYFEDVFPQLANWDYQGESATQAIYTNEWAPYRVPVWRDHRSRQPGLLTVFTLARKEQNSGSLNSHRCTPGIRSV